MDCQQLFTTKEIATDYDLSATKLNKILKEQGIIYKQGQKWHINNEYKKLGLMRTYTYVEGWVSNKWTHKGRMFIYNLLKELGIHPLETSDISNSKKLE